MPFSEVLHPLSTSPLSVLNRGDSNEIYCGLFHLDILEYLVKVRYDVMGCHNLWLVRESSANWQCLGPCLLLGLDGINR